MIVVTGATGFIGRRVVGELVKRSKPKEIVCLIWKKNYIKERKWIEWLGRFGVALRVIDLLDEQSLVDLPQNPEIIFHLAATTDTASSDHRCNDIGTENLVRALAPGKNTHFVYTGTSAMYCGRRSCRKPITEKSRPCPTNRYGRSKLHAEVFLKKEAKKRGYFLTILRPPTVYGSNPRTDSLFDFMKKLINQNSLLARLNWPGLTSLVWVDDVARVITWAAKNPPKRGSTNEFLVSVESITLADISRLMHRGMGRRYARIDLPDWFWKLAADSRRLIFATEKMLPSRFYNLFWRATLVVDDVLYCDASKIGRSYKAWKPGLLKDKINEVI